MRNSLRNGSPWVRKPEPMISTPSSRSGRSRSPSVEQPHRVVGGQRHLQHRDVGLGVHDPQRHPGAVVEAAAGVLVDRLGGRHQRRRSAGRAPWRRASRRSSGSTSRRSRRSRRPAARRSALRLTGADSQCALTIRIAFGRGRSAAQAASCARPDRVVEQRRGAVADVEGGHAVSFMSSPSIVVCFNFIPGRAAATSPPARPPCSSSSRLTRLNGREPKKPAAAPTAARGARTRPTGPAPSIGLSALGVAAPQDRRAAARRARPARVIARSVTSSQPRPRCEAASPGRTVSTRLSSITPWSAQAVRSPCGGGATPRSVAQLAVDVGQAPRQRPHVRVDREAEPDRVARAWGRGPGRRPAPGRRRAAAGRPGRTWSPAGR